MLNVRYFSFHKTTLQCQPLHRVPLKQSSESDLIIHLFFNKTVWQTLHSSEQDKKFRKWVDRYILALCSNHLKSLICECTALC